MWNDENGKKALELVDRIMDPQARGRALVDLARHDVTEGFKREVLGRAFELCPRLPADARLEIACAVSAAAGEVDEELEGTAFETALAVLEETWCQHAKAAGIHQLLGAVLGGEAPDHARLERVLEHAYTLPAAQRCELFCQLVPTVREFDADLASSLHERAIMLAEQVDDWQHQSFLLQQAATLFLENGAAY